MRSCGGWRDRLTRSAGEPHPRRKVASRRDFLGEAIILVEDEYGHEQRF